MQITTFTVLIAFGMGGGAAVLDVRSVSAKLRQRIKDEITEMGDRAFINSLGHVPNIGLVNVTAAVGNDTPGYSLIAMMSVTLPKH